VVQSIIKIGKELPERQKIGFNARWIHPLSHRQNDLSRDKGTKILDRRKTRISIFAGKLNRSGEAPDKVF
jgi:hypothetical protein